MSVFEGFPGLVSNNFHKKKTTNWHEKTAGVKSPKSPRKRSEKICKFDESVFLIDGVYRERNRVYNGADNVEKMIL